MEINTEIRLRSLLLNFEGIEMTKQQLDTMIYHMQDMGLIHKSQAVDYVRSCRKCGGAGMTFIEHVYIEPERCALCKGKGLVLKQD